eukprot:TRINITY_DN1079_c0_g1_i1.p2 TRINITY_DN1079_c0_g1~~TRINITY_DN1079_c0_g1_i1.p2  ORF type:complete len:224 (-),score=28.33 TRINITY_DN1079_c0_g1_i1:1205-1777(-)
MTQCMTKERYPLYGGFEHENAEIFVKHFETLTTSNGDEGERSKIFPTLLTRPTLDWYCRKAGRNSSPKSWAEWKIAFLDQFRSVVPVRVVLAELQYMRKRRSETIADYIHRFLRLLDMFPSDDGNPGCSAFCAREWFLWGLPKEIDFYCRIRSADIWNLDGVIVAAEDYASAELASKWGRQGKKVPHRSG